MRSVAGKLDRSRRPLRRDLVRISHFSDVQSRNAGFSHLEREITQVVELLHRKETELLRSEQLAIVGQLAAGMAHELRNPLMPIKVLVQSTLARVGRRVAATPPTADRQRRTHASGSSRSSRFSILPARRSW